MTARRRFNGSTRRPKELPEVRSPPLRYLKAVGMRLQESMLPILLIFSGLVWPGLGFSGTVPLMMRFSVRGLES